MAYVVISYVEFSVLVTHTNRLTCRSSGFHACMTFKCIEGLNNKRDESEVLDDR